MRTLRWRRRERATLVRGAAACMVFPSASRMC